VAGEEQVVPEPLPGLVQGDDVEDGRVGRAVIGRVRDAPEVGQLPLAQLVGDLARLGIPVGIQLGRLQVGQALEGTPGEIGEHDDVLQAGDQAVPTKSGDKPRDPGRGEQVLRVPLVTWQAQGRHVFHGLPVQPVELLVGRRDLRRHPLPVRQAVGGFQPVVSLPAFLGSGPRRVVGHEVVFAAGVPGTPRRQNDFKADASVGVHRLRAGAFEPHDQTPAKVLVIIARNQLLAVALPVAFDMAPARELLGFHFKQIGEVASH